MLLLLEPEIERLFGLDDYSCRTTRDRTAKSINLYVAYYASQRKDDKPHSPNDCIPGSGWNITRFQRTTYVDNGKNWPLNRVVIEKNADKATSLLLVR